MAVRFTIANGQCLTANTDASAIKLTSALTVSYWFRDNANGNPVHRYLLAKYEVAGDWASYYGYYVLVTPAGHVSAICANGARYGRTGTTNVFDGDWHHIVATFTGGSATHLYVDGQEETYEADYNTPIASIGYLTTPLQFGRLYYPYVGGSQYFGPDGDAYDIRIYNRVINTSEISAIRAAAGGDSITSGLVLRYHLAQTSGSATGSVTDLSPSNITGTFYGGVAPTYVASPEPINQPPSCSLALASNIARTVIVTLTGQDGDSAMSSGSVNWDDGETATLTVGDIATLQAGSSVTLEHTYATGGVTYDIVATLTDEHDASNTDTLSVAVAANATPTCGVEYVSLTNRLVRVRLTAADPDGLLATAVLHWGGDEDDTTIAGAPALAALADGVEYEHAYPSEGGSFGITADVTDSEGASNTSNNVAVVVSANSVPVASFTVETDGLSVTINANASNDPDGSIVSWRYQVDEAGAWADGALGESAVYVYEDDGDHTVTVEVTDNEGMTDTATTIITLANNGPGTTVTTRPFGVFMGIGL